MSASEDSRVAEGAIEQPAGRRKAGRFAAFAVLRLSDFRFLFISTGLLMFAFEMRTMAQSWLALELTDSQAWVGAVSGIPALAVIGLSLVGGIVSDRAPKRDILVWSRVALAALAFAAGYLVVSEIIEVWHLILFALVQGSIVAFGMPANTAITYEIVGRERLLSATSLMQSLSNLGVIAGPALGGALIGIIGVGPVYMAVGGVYVAAASATFMIRARRVAERDRSRSALSELMEGLRYVRRSPLIRVLLMLNLLSLVAGFVMPIIPLYARDILEVGETGFGAMMGTFGAGSVIGLIALALAGNVRRKALLMMAATLAWGAGMIVFGFSRSFPLSLATLFVMGAAGPLYVTAIMTVAQTTISDQMRGRVTSLFMITMQLFPLGWLAGGALAVWIGNEPTLVIGGVGVALIPFLVYLLSAEFRRAT